MSEHTEETGISTSSEAGIVFSSFFISCMVAAFIAVAVQWKAVCKAVKLMALIRIVAKAFRIVCLRAQPWQHQLSEP